jgi:glutaredoxin 3
MRRIRIYTTPICPYCVRAKALLEKKGANFEEIDVLGDRGAREEMERKSGRCTVPQIFIGDEHVGGSDDLHALDREGALDPLLGK